MAYKQSEVEQLTKRRVSPISIMWRLLVFASVVFFLVLASYIGLEFGYKNILASQTSETMSQMKQLSADISETEWQDLVSFYSRLANIKGLLNNHTYPSKFIKVMEEVTDKQVYLRSLKLSATDQEVGLSGIAKSFDDLSQQLELLREREEFSDIALQSARAVTGGVDFAVNFKFNSSIWQ